MLSNNISLRFVFIKDCTGVVWLYTQLSPDRDSFLVDRDRLRHYQRQFAAHLDGMLAADDSIAEFAAAELKRWKGDGELFASAYLALARPESHFGAQHESRSAARPESRSGTPPALVNGQLFAVVRDFLQAHPQAHFVEAVAHVFPWLEKHRAQEVLGAWIVSEDALLQRIALAALGLRREAYPPERASTQPALSAAAATLAAPSAQGQPMQSALSLAPLTTFFTHQDPALRAEASRYAGRLRRFDCLAQLRHALTDPDPDADVREQAAIALLVCNEPAAALPELFAALMRYAALVDNGGIASIRAERRAQHVARLLGHAIPFPCAVSAAEALLAQLPPYLAILTLAYHGNPALIPLLLPFLRNGGNHGGLYKRRALWAIGFILGINPEHEGLLADDPSLSADWPIAPGLDQDTGLPEGDADKVERWWQAHHGIYIQLSTVSLSTPPSSTPPSSKSSSASTSQAPTSQMLAPAPAPLLSGKRMDAPVAAKELLASGMQAQRFAAALHACRLSPTAPWVDTRAPWAMQKRWMEQIPE